MKNFKKLCSVILCLAIALSVFCACVKDKKTELSGKNTVLRLDRNFSLDAALYLEEITSFSGVKAKEKLRSFIVNELLSAGYSEEQIEIQKITAFGIVPGKNIVLTVPGKRTDRQIIVAGHYDGNGAGDNGSGTALLLAQAIGLSQDTPAYTVKYIFFDEEELGMIGAKSYAKSMTDEEIASTAFMVNIDSIAFGDYVCVYGGNQDDETQVISQTEAYDLAMKYAHDLGFNVYGTKELDGYFASHDTGPALDAKGVFTNPWTVENPAPKNMSAVSPSTIPASDHVPFVKLGIPYIYFEATNWFAAGKMNSNAYTGYFETYDSSIGSHGMFMNTRHDTLENLEKYFPGRAMEHFNIYSPLLSKLILEAKG